MKQFLLKATDPTNNEPFEREFSGLKKKDVRTEVNLLFGKQNIQSLEEIKPEPKRDMYSGAWITEKAIGIIRRYEKGVLTLRALHYQLVAIGMTNTVQHYKRVVNAMIDARWNGLVDFAAFSDHDREVLGETKYEETIVEDAISQGKRQVGLWMKNYYKNKWENQPIYPEVWIEKKALQGVFQTPCNRLNVALAPCKGYPSLTFLYEAKNRFEVAIEAGKQVVILYFGDYDASGEDIPRSIYDNFLKFGIEVEVKRIALKEEQVIEWNLPPAPTKSTDSRAANWDGLGQVELDAVDMHKLRDLCSEAIDEVFDADLYEELEEQETEERKQYIRELKEFVNNMEIDLDDEDEDQ